jgi:hypothetical protein
MNPGKSESWRITFWVRGASFGVLLNPRVRVYAAIMKDARHNPMRTDPTPHDFVAFEASPDLEGSPTLS